MHETTRKLVVSRTFGNTIKKAHRTPGRLCAAVKAACMVVGVMVAFDSAHRVLAPRPREKLGQRRFR
jgi:hypothetical protein